MFGLGRYCCGIDMWYHHPDGHVVRLFWRLYLAGKSGVGAGRANCRHLFWRLWYVPTQSRRNICLQEAARQDDYYEYMAEMNRAINSADQQAEKSTEQSAKEETQT